MNRRTPNTPRPPCSSLLQRQLHQALRAAVMAAAVAMVTPALAAGPLAWLAGNPGSEGNLDGPAPVATWAGGPLMLHPDGDGVLVADHYGSTLRRIDRHGHVTTLAGGPGHRGLADGRGAAARFSWPSDAVRGPDGRIYIADSGNNAIRVLSADGDVSTWKLRTDEAQDPSSDEPVVDNPQALTFDGEGRLWVLQKYAGVGIVLPDGQLQRWAPEGARSEIVDIATDGRGQVWGITPTALVRLHPDRLEVVVSMEPPEWEPPIGYRVSPPSEGPVAARYGQVPFVGRGPLPPQPAPPPEARAPEFRALGIDPSDGSVYIAEAERLMMLRPGSDTLRTLFTLPQPERRTRDDGFVGISVRPGEVLVSTPRAGIYRLDAGGTPRPYSGAWLPWDDLTRKAETPDYPIDVDDTALSRRDGSVLFLDRLDHAIGRIDAKGVSTLWAGGHDEKGRRDGPRLEARFHFPADMVQDHAGNVYVADGGNGSIRRIDSDGHVSTLAGHSSTRQRVDGIGRDARFWRPKHLALDEGRGILYVLDTSPYIGLQDTRLRSVTLATGEVRTIVTAGDDFPLPVDDATLEKLEATGHFATFDYEDIAVGANGIIYALAGHVVWRIDPADGRHTLFFAEGDNPAKDAHYEALAAARERGEDRDRLENHLIRCDWVWCGPDRIEADAQGRVYVSDSGNHTLVRIDPDGSAGVIAGQPGRRGNLVGPLPGSLNRPGGLGWTPDGALMINTDRQGIMLLRDPHKAPMRERVPVAPALK